MQDNSGREKFSRTLIVFTLQQLPLISSQMWEELRGIDTLDSFLDVKGDYYGVWSPSWMFHRRERKGESGG